MNGLFSITTNLYTSLVVAVVFVWLSLGGVAAAHAIMFKRDPRASVIWVIVSFTVPFVGPWMYWGFGINRIRRRAIRHKSRRIQPLTLPRVVTLHPDIPSEHDAVAHLRDLFTLADRVTEMPMLGGNTVEPLYNGEEAYPAMLDAIRSASKSVTLASYIFDWDAVGMEFTDALGDAARRGISVHVLLDGIGAVQAFSRVGRRLIKSGAEVSAFFPLRFPLGRLRLNLRNHRKILVVDGHTGFTGGMNISNKHYANRSAPDRVSDIHFKITGPVVAELQHAFADDWHLATDQTLDGQNYYPSIEPAGQALCRGISSGPDENIGKIHWIIQGALSAARHTVHVVTPYFIPSRALLASMIIAAMRGVNVNLYLPSNTEPRFMQWAADAYLWELLEHGIHVFRQPPPFAHTKLLVVDARWLLFGSANLDVRSFRLNFEFNVEAYNSELGQLLDRGLTDLQDRSRRITLDEIDARPIPRRLRDGLVKLFSPFL